MLEVARRRTSKLLPLVSLGQAAKVMEKGLLDSPVARLEGTMVVLKAIPTEPARRVKYHNSLMQLCGLRLTVLFHSISIWVNLLKLHACYKQAR